MKASKELFLMQQAYSTLFSLTNKVQIAGDQYLKGITSRQYMTMIAMAHLNETERTLMNIARKLGTTKQSVKQLVTLLEKQGYVVSVPSTTDKRAVNIKFTESGIQIMLDCEVSGTRFFADLFNDFTSDEIELFWTLLKKLYRFDGESHDGFEADTVIDTGRDHIEFQERILNEFEKQRNSTR